MPTYEFACLACGASFEDLVWSAADIDAVTCPHCGSPDVRRKVSGFAGIGSGRAGTGAVCAGGG